MLHPPIISIRSLLNQTAGIPATCHLPPAACFSQYRTCVPCLSRAKRHQFCIVNVSEQPGIISAVFRHLRLAAELSGRRVILHSSAALVVPAERFAEEDRGRYPPRGHIVQLFTKNGGGICRMRFAVIRMPRRKKLTTQPSIPAAGLQTAPPRPTRSGERSEPE